MNFQQENNDQSELRVLIAKALNGSLCDEERDQLQTFLRSGSQARAVYIETLNLYSNIINLFGSESGDSYLNYELDFDDSEISNFDSTQWQLLAEMEKTAPNCVISEPEKISSSVKIVPQYQPVVRHKVNKLALYTAVIGWAALFLVILFLQINPIKHSEAVAVVTDMIDAKWDSASSSLEIGESLHSGDDYRYLLSGLVKLQYNYGTEVVIEGPAQFYCASQEDFYLHFGRAVTHVPRGATGFVLETPTSKIIDLGTEFGVDVHAGGDSVVQVYRGKVSLISGRRGQALLQKLLSSGQAGKVDSKTSQILSVAMEEDMLVRDIDSGSNMVWKGQDISLADIVGGGNGLGTGKFGHGINFNETDVVSNPFRLSDSMELEGYNLIDNPYIDGVFVPDASQGSQVVSSLDHLFTACPVTLNKSPGFVSNLLCVNSQLIQSAQQRMATASEQQAPAIYVHSNQGITFDLDAIRKDFPQLDITEFTTGCAISAHASQGAEVSQEVKNMIQFADFYVLVDGQARLTRNDVSSRSQLPRSRVKIHPQDRFLTLVVTEGRDRQTTRDWAYYADPVLRLELK